MADDAGEHAPAPLEAPQAALDAAVIDAGDAKWRAGDRAGAVQLWRGLSGRGAATHSDATEVMLRVRLLPVSGNLGPLWLEPPLDRAMQRCGDLAYAVSRPAPESPAAWCRVAMADYDVWMPAIAGADPRRVEGDLAMLRGWAPADARIAAAAAARAPFPGTWVLGWGVSVAPGAGAGVGLHFVHPDLGFEGHRLALDGSVDTLGGFSLSGSFAERPSRRSLVVRVAGGNLRGTAWGAGRGDTPAAYAWQTVQGAAGFASTFGRLSVAGGGEARWDHAIVGGDSGIDASGGAAVGPWANARWSGPVDLRLAGDVNGTQAGPAFAMVTGSVRGAVVGRGEHAPRAGKVAWRALGEVATDGPFYRLPSAGGSTLLRGAPAGRYRGPVLAGAQVEYRHVVYGPVYAAAFADAAWVSGWTPAPFLDDAHVSFGGGARLVLPPGDLNTTRVDFGVVPGLDGTVSWGLVLGWGEAF